MLICGCQPFPRLLRVLRVSVVFFIFCAGQNRSAGVLTMVNGHDSNLDCDLGPEFLGRLFDRHAATLELYARQICDCAEDAVQEALIELAGQSRRPENATAWLFRVVRNKALSAARTAQRRRRHEAHAGRRRPAWFVRSPDDRLDGDAAAAALASLAVEQREVVVARIWGQLSFQEIGELIGASDSAAHRRYESALSALRQKLRTPCPKKETAKN